MFLVHFFWNSYATSNTCKFLSVQFPGESRLKNPLEVQANPSRYGWSNLGINPSRYRACIPQKWCRVLKATRNNPSTPSISEMNPPRMNLSTGPFYLIIISFLSFSIFFYCFVYYVWRLFWVGECGHLLLMAQYSKKARLFHVWLICRDIQIK